MTARIYNAAMLTGVAAVTLGVGLEFGPGFALIAGGILVVALTLAAAHLVRGA